MLLHGCPAVFHARLLDDLMIASYCNNASDRIILQLLHRWHMSWASVQAFGTRANEQQQLPQRPKQALQQEAQCYQGRMQQQKQQQSDHDATRLGDVTQGQDQDHTHVGPHAAAGHATPGTQQGVAAEQQLRQQRVRLAATVVADQLRKTAGPNAPAAAAAALSARAAEQLGVPTLLQVFASIGWCAKVLKQPI